MLLYLVVKNHSFVDGNKRIAATLFLWFMQSQLVADWTGMAVLAGHDELIIL